MKMKQKYQWLVLGLILVILLCLGSCQQKISEDPIYKISVNGLDPETNSIKIYAGTVYRLNPKLLVENGDPVEPSWDFVYDDKILSIDNEYNVTFIGTESVVTKLTINAAYASLDINVQIVTGLESVVGIYDADKNEVAADQSQSFTIGEA